MNTKITEIIPENMPDWAREAMNEGQLWNRVFAKIADQAAEIEQLKEDLDLYSDGYA